MIIGQPAHVGSDELADRGVSEQGDTRRHAGNEAERVPTRMPCGGG